MECLGYYTLYTRGSPLDTPLAKVAGRHGDFGKDPPEALERMVASEDFSRFGRSSSVGWAPGLPECQALRMEQAAGRQKSESQAPIY